MSANAWLPESEKVPQTNVSGLIKREVQVPLTEGQHAFELRTFSYVPNTGSLLVFVDGKVLTDGQITEATATQVIIKAGVSRQQKVVFVAIVGISASVAIDEILRQDLIGADGSEFVYHGAEPLKDVLDALQMISYDQLRAYEGNREVVFMSTYGIAGTFVIDHADGISADDGGCIIIDAIGRRWKRKIAEFVLPSYYGAIPYIAVDQGTKIQAAWEGSVKLKAKLLIDAPYSVLPKPRVYPDDLIRNVGLQIPSNSHCVFLPEGRINTLPMTGPVNAYTINAYLADNFVLEYPKVYGDRDTHIGELGEYGHCFNLVNCTNGYVKNLEAYDAVGDGVYLGIEYFSATNKQTKDVTLEYPWISNCRRNALSVTSGINLTVIKPYTEKTNGTAPQAGIDCEMEGVGATAPECVNWVIDSPVTDSNSGAGIVVYTDSMPTNGKVDITINNHHDKGSQAGAVIQHGNNVVTGTVRFNNPVWENNKANALVVKATVNGPMFTVDNFTAKDCGINFPVADWPYASPVAVSRVVGEPAAAALGNFNISGRTLDTRAVKKSPWAVYGEDAAAGNALAISNATINITENTCIYAGRAKFLQSIAANCKLHIDGDYQLTIPITRGGGADNEYFDKVSMSNAAESNVIITAAGRQPLEGVKVAAGAVSFGFKPSLGGRIYPLGDVNQIIYSNDPGASIKLIPLGTGNDWVAQILSGTWAAIP